VQARLRCKVKVDSCEGGGPQQGASEPTTAGTRLPHSPSWCTSWADCQVYDGGSGPGSCWTAHVRRGCSHGPHCTWGVLFSSASLAKQRPVVAAASDLGPVHVLTTDRPACRRLPACLHGNCKRIRLCPFTRHDTYGTVCTCCLRQYCH
jgi:hypothetical protein